MLQKRSPMRAAFLLLMTTILVVQIYPVLWIFSTSFKTIEETTWKSPLALPESLNPENYIRAFSSSDLPRYYLNSTVITAFTLLLIVLFSATAAFAIEKLRFRFNKVTMGFFLSGIAIPLHITLIPLFIIYKNTGLLNSWLSLILPQVGFGLPLAIYLFCAFYKYIPASLFEAAVIDGASVPRIFTAIYAPLSKNTIMTVVTVNLITVWNEFVFANTFITASAMKTIPVGLYDYVGERGLRDWGATFAAVSLALIPLLIVYFIFNKSIIAGMTTGAIKE